MNVYTVSNKGIFVITNLYEEKGVRKIQGYASIHGPDKQVM